MVKFAFAFALGPTFWLATVSVSTAYTDQPAHSQTPLEQLLRRSEAGTGSTIEPTSSATNSAFSTSTSAAATTIASGLPGLPPGYNMPQSFDAILGTNFTSSSCPNFFATFLGDTSFSDCYPLSLLLDTSTSFFKAMQNSSILPSVMNQICSVDESTCSAKMDELAVQITSDNNCGADLAKGNALATAALNGFQNYKILYEAGCLKDSKTQAFCFTEAANATSPSDLYIFDLPGGTDLPSGSRPSCDTCSKAVMSVYSNYASNDTLRISQTYNNARNTLSLQCGPSFAPLVAATNTSKSSATMLSSCTGLALLTFLTAITLVTGV